LPLAASTVLQISEIGTVPPPTKPSDTTARKKGHGLFAETPVCGVGALSCMGPILKAPKSSDQPRFHTINGNANTSGRYLRMQEIFGGIRS